MGKTSLLVQFDQGKFQTGSFAATVGIGFTVSALFSHLTSEHQSLKQSCFDVGPASQTDDQPLLQRFVHAVLADTTL